MKVLFCSTRPLQRAENVKAVWDAWEDEKEFAQMDQWLNHPALTLSDYDVIVSDEFISRKIKGTKAILIGHGISGGKTWGLDQPIPYVPKDCGKMFDAVVATSEEMVPIVARQCGVERERVYPLGMPRTDAYFEPCVRPTMKQTYLYAPTFRNQGEGSLPDIDWQWLDDQLTNNEALIVKAHMVGVPILDREYEHIVELSGMLPSTPWLMGCDALITDYSSIMLDAQLLGKPVILYSTDNRYLITRGMYLPYPDGYSSRFAGNEQDLLRLLRTAKGQNETDVRCRQRTAGCCDGHSTERVIQLIKNI